VNGWTKSEGIPDRAIPNALVQDPTRSAVFHLGMFRPAGYLRSEDGGKSFSSPGTWPGGALESLATCPSAPKRLYAAVERLVLRSDDDGKSWQRAAMRGFKPSSRPHGIQLVADPTDASRLFLLAAGAPEVLWRSTDSGESWTRMDRGLSGRQTHPSMVLPPLLAVTKSGVKVALLGGGRLAWIGPGEDRWQETTPRAPRVEAEWVSADPHAPSRLWRTGQGRLWRSDDGRRWQRVGDFVDALVVFCDTGKPGRLVVTRKKRLALSDDHGKTWRAVDVPEGAVGALAGENLLALSEQGMFWRKR
jgi:photosystem II stability/assembly factor-like uncharacterized protein